MKEQYIAVLDSGIGGISVLNEMIKIMPNEKYLYFGDNKNAPYGNRTEKSLKDITFKNIDAIKQYNIKALVVGCNTLSTTILPQISEYASVATFGVFPPVESSIVNGERTLLLCTNKTAEKYKNIKEVTVVGLERLANDIEQNLSNLDAVDFITNIEQYSRVFCGNLSSDKCCYDTIILGCTHYVFIKNKIFNHFRPRKMICGEIFTAKVVYEFLKNTKSLEKYKRFSIDFLGESAKINEEFYKKSGHKELNLIKKI